MSRINYNPSAIKTITVWEPVCVSVADELAHQLWAEHPMMRNLSKEERERCGKRWRRSGITYSDGQWDSKVVRSGVFFDNKGEAMEYLENVMIPEYRGKVEAGVYTPCAGKTKPGFSEVKKHIGLDPNRPNGDDFWDAYFNYVIRGKVDTRNSYAYKSKQYTWKTVDAFALRVEKKTLYVPAA